jgi:hypothetical protein
VSGVLPASGTLAIENRPRKETSMNRYEYKVLDTGKDLEEELNALGAEGWQVVGVTTKKQLLIAPPQAIILMREVQPRAAERTAHAAHALA